MSQTVPAPPEPGVDSETLLEEMGYKEELNRELNIFGNPALVLSDITPTASCSWLALR